MACKKGGTQAPTPPASFSFNTVSVNGTTSGLTYRNVNRLPVVQLSFTAPIEQASIANAVTFTDNTGTKVPYTVTLGQNDSMVVVQPSSALQAITPYTINVSVALTSKGGGSLQSAVGIQLTTALDSTDKFPRISDSALLTLVEQRTFAYFWDFGHPDCGMARERNTSGDVVTTGGSGFGIMSILVGIYRNFISRADGLARVQRIVTFLTDSAQRYHGAFPHWINGATGATVPFSAEDDGADLVETAYLMEGLLTARQFFNSPADSAETALRAAINVLWTGVDWGWFRQNGQNTLYWHWSPDYAWSTNQQINGWNEALITYILAASAPVDSIPKVVYDDGWAGNGSIRNGNAYYNVNLPLGPAEGGPLFFAHYSFLGLDPRGLSDAYAGYWNQDTAQATINYRYCVANPLQYYGYSADCWGLTASDDNVSGYSAHSPTNDLGIISPTAAIASLPYTPTPSMNALRFFYYTLGDKIWGQYGFTDAFNLTNVWFATSYLAIDQGPEIIMIENYRSALLWNLFMSCPEIKNGLRNLGFQDTGH
ncbi:glucoamylase family protein [Dinghuibacter silviterrae]|nr:glucoamylase family protein [Dinghuibacter silviterrae]